MEESTYHVMGIYQSQRLSSMLCLFLFCVHFFIIFLYDFHADAERMIVKTLDM